MSDAVVSPAPAPSPTKRKRRWLRWALGGVVVLGGTAAAAPWLLSTSWMNGVIRGWLNDNLERKVDFQSVAVSWQEGVTIRGLVVHDEAPGQAPVLEAPSVVLKAPILPMLWRQFEVEEFAIDDAVVRVAQRGDGVNAAKVVRRKKGRRRSGGGAGEAEPLVLPEVEVPVVVRNLTLAFVDETGREVRRPGIAFRGHLSTRDLPTTFDLDVPTSGNGRIRVTGEAALFDADGLMLTGDALRADTKVEVRGVDAQANADVLAMFLPGRPAAGVLDATVDAHYAAGAASGAIDLRVRGVAVGDAVGKRASAADDDLTVTGRFEARGAAVRLDGLKVRAEGLAVDGDLAGEFPALDGKLTLDADLARMGAALRAFGIEIDERLAGVAKGELTFSPSPALGKGRVALTGFRAESAASAHPPVSIDRAEVAFAGAPEGESFRLDSLDLVLAELTARASGRIGRDGALDVTTEARGDLGKVLARARDLGFLPSGFSVSGTLDAAVTAKGRAGGEGADALTIDIARCTLAEEDARVELTGRATAGGQVDLAARGSGDLGKLLGRAQQAGVQGPGLDAVRGRFTFEATAKGAPGALAVRLPQFRLDGDLAVEASGEWNQAGPLSAKVRADGKIDDALLLARRLGLLDGDAKLDGTLRADATLAGTADALQVPSFTVNAAGPSLTLDASGSMAADRTLRATAKGSADLMRLAEFAQRSKLADGLPPARGRLTFDVEAAGRPDRIALPRFHASLTGGPADAEVSGAVTEQGSVTGTLRASGSLAGVTSFAHEAGWLPRPLTPPGQFTFDAGFSGTREFVRVPAAELKVTGLVQATVQGSYDTGRMVHAGAHFEGPLQPLLDAAAQWTGEPVRRVDGTVRGSVAADGPLDQLTLAIPRVTVHSAGLTVEADGTSRPDGDAIGNLAVRGALADLVSIAQTFGFAADVAATGSIDVAADVRIARRKATGSATASVADLVLTRPEVGGAPFRDPRCAVTAPSFVFDLDTGRLEPVKLGVRFEGASVDATVSMEEGPPSKDFAATRIVRADGKLEFGEAFARNHADLLSGASFTRVAGPFQFAGDVSQGRAAAAGWTGGGELTIENLVAPHVTADRARATAKLEGGLLLLDPIEGTVNGGPVTGRASIGLVGERPEHAFDLTGKDVSLASDLAPLVARASPLFAVGERGRTGGKAGIDVHLKARGLDADAIKASLTGNGTLALKDAFVESGDWIGTLLSLVGSSGRLDLSPVDVPFEVSGGRVRTGDLAMQGIGLALRMAGEVGLDGKIDYGLRVKPTSASSAFSKYASFLDPEGFLPLRLEGRLAKPKLRAPDLKDLLGSKLDDLLGGLGGKKDDDKDDPAPPKDKPKRRKPKDGDAGGSGDAEDEPPPPPPKKAEDEPPPPPPPPPKKRK